MIMISYWEKKLKKRFHVLETEKIKFNKKHESDAPYWKDAFSTECIPNDRHCACLSNKSLSY